MCRTAGSLKFNKSWFFHEQADSSRAYRGQAAKLAPDIHVMDAAPPYHNGGLPSRRDLKPLFHGTREIRVLIDPKNAGREKSFRAPQGVG